MATIGRTFIIFLAEQQQPNLTWIYHSYPLHFLDHTQSYLYHVLTAQSAHYHHLMSPPCICIINSQHQHHERRPAGVPLIVWPDSNKVCTVGRELSTGTIRLRKVYTHFQTNKIGQTWKTMSKLGHTYFCTWTGVSG